MTSLTRAVTHCFCSYNMYGIGHDTHFVMSSYKLHSVTSCLPCMCRTICTQYHVDHKNLSWESSAESVAPHAYRVFSLSQDCTSSRFTRDGRILCTLHAEWWAVSQIVLSLEPTKMSQTGDSGELIHSKMIKTQTESKYAAKINKDMINILKDDDTLL